MHATIYPGADTRTQWRGNGGVTMSTVDKLVLHTTESSGWPAYPDFQPTLTFNPWSPRGKRWRQHHPINGSASTLRNAGTFKTNRVCCQIEIVAYCDPGRKSIAWIGNITDDAYAELGEFLAWINFEWEVPLNLAPNWLPYPQSYGDTNVRMSVSEYSAFKGVLGHQHVPGNNHGDPGGLNVHEILRAALMGRAMVETKSRTMSFNVRNKAAVADIPFPSRHWSKRLPVIVKVIKDAAVSVLGVQECRQDMAADITQGLGPNWTFWGSGTSKVIWDTLRWVAVDYWEGGLLYTQLGIPRHRPITMVKLKKLDTGGMCWFISTHLAVHVENEANQRVEQAKRAIQLIAERPDNGRVVIFGDFNDVPETSGVRKVFTGAGYKTLRAALSDEAMVGDSRNTFNGWKLTKRDGKWLDDVLTSKAVKPYAGEVILTDTSAYPIHASDHNGVLGRVSYTTSNLTP